MKKISRKFVSLFLVVVMLFTATALTAISSAAAESYRVGDANLDGKISIRDVSALQLCLAELSELDEAQTYIADADGNGTVTILDATYIQMYLARIEKEYPQNADGYAMGEEVPFADGMPDVPSLAPETSQPSSETEAPSEPITESTTESTEAPTESTKPSTEPTTPTTAPTTQPVTEPTTRVHEYYNTYSEVAFVADTNGCEVMQGMAIGTTYIYSVKIKADNTSAVIARTNKNSGETILMSNGGSGYYFTNLYHANDMCIKKIDNQMNLFIATMKDDSQGLVRLAVDGTTLINKGSFQLKLDGENTSMSAIDVLEKTSTDITFLCKKGKKFYTGTVSTSASSGNIKLTELFKINTTDVTINKKTVDVSSYTHQGFGLEGNTLYVPLWNSENPCQSVIVVYDISKRSGTIKADEYLSFRITSSAYSSYFEIESCGVNEYDGRLYFNVNRSTPTNANQDAILYFNGYDYNAK